LIVERFLCLLIISIMLDRSNADKNVLLKVVMLNFFPLGGKVSNSTLSKFDFIRGEFAILAQSIKADDKLNLLGLESLRFNIVPFAG
jgi:hypothetical protein